jgi:hypothetical protein|tara:strand:+ start:61 stop:813 length:753 start_codon:yes stop_codon:yes gene_type:complete
MKLEILQCNKNLVKGEDLKWCNGEGIKDYKKNRKRLGPKWRYYNSLDLTYNLNSHGYRAKEFNEYNWSKSTLFFGCSHVFGTGVHHQHTIPSQYEELTGTPSINMGVTAGSTDCAHHNTHACIEANYIPKQVVIIWPGPIRSIQYHDEGFTNIGSWSTGKYRKVFEQYISYDEHYITKSYLLQQSIIESWKAYGVKVYGFKIWQEKFTDNDFLVSYPTIKNDQYVDKARDCGHNGPLTNKNWAELVANTT